MSNIYKQALLVSKAKASVFTMEYISQFEASDIDSDDVDLRFEVDGVETGTTVSIVDECGHAAQIITALLDELETKEEQRANWFQMAQKLGEDLDAAEKRNAELREYYEGVIADGSKRIAELEAKLSKPVLLPKTNGYWNEQEKAYEEAITLARRQIRLAGFRCEGDE
ncbi:ead/Ea22-like family protein [Salmonella enterica subsp. enterica serovar Norwich]|uniref:Ead/Ea22-like family protein n=1 Tax=Salmonella enterica TaxID=28901 RepID=A0A5Z1ZIR4_SALER|nr:ead/Ea22-like family protein [Salmonella enterica]EBM0825000.1 ead/Ea22-like family protein [Salmonella enterica]ECR3853178.1 ead/Ea22-like family protein [Salmonella enterica]EIE9225653.1 ead/Ea22-like family protein [Salmonella enterica]EIG6897086.1 ead/Ea22-like family protein [Salmonella enterica]